LRWNPESETHNATLPDSLQCLSRAINAPPAASEEFGKKVATQIELLDIQTVLSSFDGRDYDRILGMFAAGEGTLGACL
jgi:hypothetical protein